MGMDFNIKPVGGSVATPYIEPSPEGAKAAVQTQLPPEKAVTAPDASVAARNNPRSDSDDLSHQIVIDRAAAEVVYRVVDSRTSVVVRQFPDDARLRARAYLRAEDIAKQEDLKRYTDRTA
jgi:hypothetical protein